MIQPFDKIIEIRESSWSKTKEILLSLYRDGYNFRGHRIGSWNLESSLERTQFYNSSISTAFNFSGYYTGAFRHMYATGLFGQIDNEIVEKDFSQLFGHYRLDLNNFITDKDPEFNGQINNVHHPIINDFIALQNKANNIVWQMQHHGVPTHLIDITRSFYVAAYFALFNSKNEISSSNENCYPAIFCIINHYDTKNPWESIFRHYHKKRKIEPFVHDRILKQQGGYINSLFNSKFDIRKVYLSPSWIKQIYADLSIMNINGFTLFGTYDMAGIDYYFNAKYGGYF